MVNTSFIESPRFPTPISSGSTGGPSFFTEIAETGGGHEERNTPQAYARQRFDIKWGIRTQVQAETVLNLFHVCRGKLRGFPYRNPDDYKTSPINVAPSHTDAAMSPAFGDGANTVFRFQKFYTWGGETYLRRVWKPLSGTVLIGKNGILQSSGFTIDYVNGTVTFSVAPASGAVMKWGGEFDIPVRFDTDYLPAELYQNIRTISSIPLIELLGKTDLLFQ